MTNPYLELSDPAASAKRLELPRDGKDLVVGRSPDCQLVIASGAVSRHHARIRRENDRVTVEDLGSSNGTFVNGVRLSAPAELKDRDRVSFGTVDATFFAPPAAPDATVTLSPPPVQVESAPPPPAVSQPAPAPSVPAQAPLAPPPAPTAPIPSAPVAEATAPVTAGAAAEKPAPSITELAAIALGSFVAVYGIGWALIRYVF